MLAQSFKTASELRISEEEHDALIKVLGMLERGELERADTRDEGDFLFNMDAYGKGCGTPACIGGWVAILMEVKQYKYIDRHWFTDSPLHDLYWGHVSPSTTVEQAATATRNFLTTGDPCWGQTK